MHILFNRRAILLNPSLFKRVHFRNLLIVALYHDYCCRSHRADANRQNQHHDNRDGLRLAGPTVQQIIALARQECCQPRNDARDVAPYADQHPQRRTDERTQEGAENAGQQIALLLLVNRLLIFHRVYLPFAFSARCFHYIGERLPCQVSIRLQHLRQRLLRDVPAEAAPRQHRRNALIRLARILVGLRARRCFFRQCNRVRQLGILANRG